MQAEAKVPDFIERSFHLPYGPDAGDFRFNVMAILTVLAAVLFFATGYNTLVVVGAATGCTAYYFWPLVDKKTPRIGGGQYGVFIDGFGLISWRAISDVQLITYATRFNEEHELQFRLRASLDRALLADWRALPVWRLLMKLPWTMTHENVVRIALAPFAPPPEDIHREFERLWKYYR
jgi:hypothetical protein